MAKVYLETSYFSAYVSTRTGARSLGWRITSRDWWRDEARKHKLFISSEVITELSNPRFQSSAQALAMLGGLTLLPASPEDVALAGLLVSEHVMPGPASAGDALHVAIAIMHRMDYILSWNVKHLANPNKLAHLGVICLRLGITPPRIVTPDVLVGGD